MRRPILGLIVLSVALVTASVARSACLFRCSYFKPAHIFECLSGPVLENCHTDVVPGGAVCWGVNCDPGSPVEGTLTRWLRVDPQELAPVVGPEVAALLESVWRTSAEAAALGRPGLAPGEFSGSVALGDRPLEVTFSIAGNDTEQAYVFRLGDGTTVELTLAAPPAATTATVRYRVARPGSAVEEGSLELPLASTPPTGELVLRARPAGSGG